MLRRFRIQLVIFLTVYLPSVIASQTSGNKVIVTMLLDTAGNSRKYLRLLNVFVYTLRQAGYTNEILLLINSNFPIKERAIVNKLGISIKTVDKISIPTSEPRYKDVLTKFELWNLTEYDQVMFYDVDFFFIKNPASAFDLCGEAVICACLDVRQDTPGYFNTGFLIIRPNLKEYMMLLSKISLALDKQYPEQDALNEIYSPEKYTVIPYIYNYMHAKGPIPKDVIAIHEKLWILKQNFPQLNYPWNGGHFGNVGLPSIFDKEGLVLE